MAKEQTKPLFIPLMRQYYEAFLSGEKKFEYRKYGCGWHEGTCVVGRPVTLSMGYGKAHRVSGVITSFEVVHGSKTPNPESVKDVYGTLNIEIAKIGIRLT